VALGFEVVKATIPKLFFPKILLEDDVETGIFGSCASVLLLYSKKFKSYL
jgi:hypothetical protein